MTIPEQCFALRAQAAELETLAANAQPGPWKVSNFKGIQSVVREDDCSAVTNCVWDGNSATEYAERPAGSTAAFIARCDPTWARRMAGQKRQLAEALELLHRLMDQSLQNYADAAEAHFQAIDFLKELCNGVN